MPENIILVADDSEERLDTYISQFTDLTRSRAASLIEKGAVLVNGSVKKKNYTVATEDRIEISLPELSVLMECLPENLPLDIVYEDEYLVVVNKPQGMVVHPAAGNFSGTLVNALLYHCGDKLSGINGVMRPGIVHRIDKNTSGLLVVAKNDLAHNSLALQLKEHTIDRIYNAVLHGTLPDAGQVRFAIGRSKNDRKMMAAFPEGTEQAGVRHAVTNYKLLEGFGKFSFAEFKLETGRTHQIRVHMKAIGHPIVGDDVYASDSLENFGLCGQCLHARILGFVHPVSGKKMIFDSPLPEHFERVLTKIRKKYQNEI